MYMKTHAVFDVILGAELLFLDLVTFGLLAAVANFG